MNPGLNPPSDSAPLVAERVGFEPTVGKPDTRSPGVPVRPLQHLSTERVGFDPTLQYKRRPLFESGTINHSVTSPSSYYTTLGEGRVRRAMISLVISTGMSTDTPASSTIPQSCRLIG